jgi:hypothetical protein
MCQRVGPNQIQSHLCRFTKPNYFINPDKRCLTKKSNNDPLHSNNRICANSRRFDDRRRQQ